jgi:sensor domain CHASE-containing protein
MNKEKIENRLKEIKSNQEHLQSQYQNYENVIKPQLVAQLNANAGAIAELEQLLKPEPEKEENSPVGNN